jgi:hypothetical protein
LVAVVGLAAVLVAGGIFASNMGFKLNYLLAEDIDAGGKDTGTTSLALPYNQQTNITDAKALIDDINLSAGTVTSVARWVKSNNAPETYTGTAGTAFPITPGEAYRVQMAVTGNYIVVGSHDPGLGIDLLADADGGGKDTGTNSFSMPYHSTLIDAKTLIDEINVVGTVTSIARWVKSNNAPETYTGTAGTAFPLTPGEGYRIQMAADAIGYIPSHF